MNGQDALNLVMSRLGNRTEPALRALCLAEMKLLAREIEDGAWKPWFLFRHLVFVGSTSAGVSQVVASNILDLDDDQAGVFYYDDTRTVDMYRRLERGMLRFLKDKYFEEEMAAPREYDMTGSGSGSLLHIFPTPDAGYQIYFSGFYRESQNIADSTDETTVWLTQVPSLIIAGTTMKMAATHTRDDTVAAANGTLYAKALQDLNTQSVSKKVSGLNLTMGDD